MEPENWYSQRLEATESELIDINKRIRFVSILRIILFTTCIVTIIGLWEKELSSILLAAACSFIPFILLVKVHNKLFNRKLWLEAQEAIIKRELKGLKNDYSDFDEGKEFINPGHHYSYDLDVFGRKSLFQAINRTCTQIGKETLAHWLQQHLRDRKSIEARQSAIQNLCDKKEFREAFAVTGWINADNTNSNDEKDIREWAKKGNALSKAKWAKLLMWGVPSINLILFLAGLLEFIPFTWFGTLFFCFIILSFSVVQRATVLQEEFSIKLKALNSYAKLIDLIEKEEWTSEVLKELTESLKINGESPSHALKKLTKELDRMDLRNNQLLYVLLEGSMFFQLHEIARIEKWKELYGSHLENWLDIVGKMDALCSLATFAYNHPSYTYPTIAEQPFVFKAKEMGHPLMPAEQCIKNDAEIPSRPFFLIITGANMAGKSTYLRTIGANYLLACIGAPVCCKELEIYPSQLVTSLRTSDSLSENESYFFAELKRLKRIIDLLNKGEELFIILDEILKGTNSTDKQKGSFNLIRQFILMKTNGIIATHDLLLGELIDQFPNEIRNYCFEADITDNELTFSYKIREGIAQNMNACFLMKKMGIAF